MFIFLRTKPILVPQKEELKENRIYNKIKVYIDNFVLYFQIMMKAIFHKGNAFEKLKILFKSLQ